MPKLNPRLKHTIIFLLILGLVLPAVFLFVPEKIQEAKAAEWDVTKLGTAFEFEGATATYNSSSKIDDTHFINFWAGSDNDGYVQVFTVDSGTGAVTAEGTALEFDTVQAIFNSCAKIDDTHFINFWAGNGGGGFAQVFTVDTDTWAVTKEGTAFKFDTYGVYNSCAKIDANHFINFWRGSSPSWHGFAQVFTVDTSTWAVTKEGTALDFSDPVYINGNNCCQIDDTHFINFWVDSSNYGWTQVFTIDLNTWAVTAEGAAFKFESVYARAFGSCAKVNNNHVINFWGGKDSDGYTQIFTIDLDTWAVTAEGTALEFDTSFGDWHFCHQIDTSHFINFWGGTDLDGFAQVFTVDTGTWAVTKEGTALEFDTADGRYNSGAQVDANHFINFWYGSGGHGYTQVFEVEYTLPNDPPNTPTNILSLIHI